MAGTAAAAALRALAGMGNTSDAFDHIAALAALCQNTQERLEQGRAAIAAGDKDHATLSFAQALVQMNRLAREAAPQPDAGHRALRG